MLLSTIDINNYKSLVDIKIKLNPKLNLLIGENNSGKSNFAESLIFLKEHLVPYVARPQNSNRRSDEDYDRKWYDLWNRDFSNKIFSKNINGSIKYELTFSLSDEDVGAFLSSLSLGDEQNRKFKSILGQKVEYTIIFSKKKLIEEFLNIYLDGRKTEFAKKTAEIDPQNDGVNLRNNENYKYSAINNFDSLDNLSIVAVQGPYSRVNQKMSMLKFQKMGIIYLKAITC